MKKLLCFILINLVPFVVAQEVQREIDDSYFEYTIEKGDSLWSISRKFDVQIGSLVKANKISRHSSSLPNIYIGETIFVPTDLKYIEASDFCYSHRTFQGINLSKVLDKQDIIKNCLDKLTKRLDVDLSESQEISDAFWKEYLSNSDYPHYFYNLFLKIDYLIKEGNNSGSLYQNIILNGENFGLGDNESSYMRAREFVLDVILEGVHRGDQINLFFMLDIKYTNFIDSDYRTIEKWNFSSQSEYENYLLSNQSEDAELLKWINLPYNEAIFTGEKFVNVDTSNLSDMLYSEYLGQMMFYTYDVGDPHHFIIKKRAFDHLEKLDSPILSWMDFSLAINLMYFNINSEDFKLAHQVGENFLKKLNLTSSADLWKTFKANYPLNEQIIDSDEWQNADYADYVLTFILNFSGRKSLYEGNYIDFQKQRAKIFDEIQDLSEKSYIHENTLVYWYGDMALEIARRGACAEAEYYFIKANETYSEDIEYYESGFMESALISLCYLNKGLKIQAQNFLEISKRYYFEGKFSPNESLDLSKDFLEVLQDLDEIDNLNVSYYSSPHRDYYYEALVILMELDLKKAKSQEDIKLILRDSAKILTDHENYLKFGWIDFRNLYGSLYTSYFSQLNEEYRKEIFHPFELIYLENRITSGRNLHHTKLDTKEAKANELSQKLKLNNDLIAKEELLFSSKEFEVDIEKLNSLYDVRRSLIQELFVMKKHLKDLHSPDYSVFSKMLENLNPNEAVLSLKLGPISSWLILKKSNEEIYLKLDATMDQIRFSLTNLNKSLKDFDTKKLSFDFESSHFLYQELFFNLQEHLSGIDTIYTLYSDTGNIPFNAIASNLVDIKNSTARLLETDFLIEKYNFVNIYPLTKKKEVDFSNNFIGFANPSNLEAIGLPSLKSAEEELQFLAMASGSRENQFYGENASKENVKKYLNDSYKRVHFGTHSVPPYWSGLNSESGLVLNSEDGNFILTASEISGLDITSDVVILSSCNPDEKGFENLYRSFLVAGSNSVIYTNWDLETSSAKAVNQELFKIFWEDESLETHQALRQSLLKLKNSYTNRDFIHPSYWANFSIAYSSI